MRYQDSVAFFPLMSQLSEAFDWLSEMADISTSHSTTSLGRLLQCSVLVWFLFCLFFYINQVLFHFKFGESSNSLLSLLAITFFPGLKLQLHVFYCMVELFNLPSNLIGTIFSTNSTSVRSLGVVSSLWRRRLQNACAARAQESV